MERTTRDDIAGPAATLEAGGTAGFLAGVLIGGIGGIGGRIAMLLLRVTSDPGLHGIKTDDGFTIGRVSTETIFLLGVTAGLGSRAACCTSWSDGGSLRLRAYRR